MIGPGSNIGPFKIQSLLGKGGMGEVFSAVDTRLDRKVALKILPPDFATDGGRLRRFQSEAKTLASLNHPNILSIFDVGAENGTPYLVSELLDGRTLREELAHGALPLRKALDYALQIAHGLAAAHARGIIHRDLKPENIFITKDGRVKILDFGLAKSTPLAMADENAATLLEGTVPGLVLGTPAYMSPEQVRGEATDERSDIFAFGCVLYEMFVGRHPFRQGTAIESLNAVLKNNPAELTSLNIAIPPTVDRLVRRCMEKRADLRFQSALDLAFALEVAAERPVSAIKTASEPRVFFRGAARPKWVLSVFFLLGLSFLAGILISRSFSPARSGGAPSVRYFSYSGRDYAPSASGDGKRICFSSDRGDGIKRIWVRDIASGSERPLTKGWDDFPRFSRDGSMILFTHMSNGKSTLYRVASLPGEEPSRIAENASYGDWHPNGHQIAFVRVTDSAHSSVHISQMDGSAERRVADFEVRVGAPRWSPRGDKIAVAVNDSGRPQAIAFIDVKTGKVDSVLPAPHFYNLLSEVAWAPSGKYLYFMQAESAAANSGGSTAVLFKVRPGSTNYHRLLWSQTLASVLDILPDGRVLMDARSSRENLKELSINGGGSRSLTLGTSTDRQPIYSRKGEDIVFSSNRGGNLDIWSISRKTGIVRRLTVDPADDWDPGFSPDGQSLVWSANRSGHFEIYIADSDGNGPQQVTKDGFAAENPTVTPDNRWIVYASTDPEKAGIWKIHPDGTGATPLVQRTTAANAEVSPDGKYALYVDSRRTSQVFIRMVEIETGMDVPFEIPVESVKETRALLGRSRWMPDGKSIVFLGQDEQGINGLFLQAFVPGNDTSSTRRKIGPFDPESSVESFAISPDGGSITVAVWEQFFSIMIAEGLQ